MVIAFLFNIFFIADLGLRWSAEGLLEFWRSEDLSWNVLDFVIVTLGVMDCVFMILAISSDVESPSAARQATVIRILRILRVVKVVRVVRLLKFFRELRMMIF